MNIPAAIEAAPAGAQFVLTPGVYRNVTISPKNGQSFVGESGAILDGSVPIENWRSQNGKWTASGYPAPAYRTGYGRDGLATYREDLFVDGTPYLRVASLDHLGPKKFYYENGNVWISDDPTGHDTVASVTEAAFNGQSARNVTIDNITVRYYATMAQHGAIDAQTTNGWTITKSVFHGNHGAGVAAGSNMTIQNNVFRMNGQLGIHAQDVTGLTIQSNRVTENNYAGFDAGWDAGGIKILTSTAIKIAQNCIADNAATGIWLDWDNTDFEIDSNTVLRNLVIGIQSEASRSGKITSNVVAYNNRQGNVTGYWGSEILVQNSSRLEVSRNKILSAKGPGLGMIYDRREPGRYGIHETRYNSLKSNYIIMLQAGQNGFDASADKTTMYDGSNVMDANTYVATSPTQLQYTWNDVWFTQPFLAAQPIERSGQFIFTNDPASMLVPTDVSLCS